MKRIFSLLSLFVLFSAAGEEILVRNAGIGGDSTVQALQRVYSDVIDYQPDCVVLAFGMNDCFMRQVPIDQYKENYLKLISQLRKNGVKHFVIMTTNPVIEEVVKPRSKPELYPAEGMNTRIKNYNKVVNAVAESENLTLFNMYQLVLENDGTSATKKSFVRNPANGGQMDGTHLTATAYRAVAKGLAPLIRNLGAKRIVCFGDSITWGANLKGAGTVSGNNYPSFLWKELNPELAAAGKEPSVMLSTTEPEGNNLIRNFSFETADDKNMPIAWILWEKNGDKAERISDGSAADGKYYIRLTGSAKSNVSFRTDIIPIKPGKYIIRGKVRGTGPLSVGLAVYERVNPKLKNIAVIESEKQWKDFEVSFETNEKVKRFYVTFGTHETVEIDNITIVPAQQEKPVFDGTAQILKNNEMSVAVAAPEKGGTITSIKNKYGKELVCAPHGGIWEFRFRKIKTDPREPVIPLAFDPEQNDGILDQNEEEFVIRAEDLKNAKVFAEKKNGTLIYRWTGIDVGDEKNVLDVTVRYRFDEKGFFLIDGGFENRSKIYTVFYYILPRLSGVGGLDGKYSDDYLAVPTHSGRLIRNPIQEGLFHKKTTLPAANTAAHSLQMDLYYNNGNGLYFGTFDPLMYTKRYQIQADSEKRICFSILNLPDNMKKIPQKWDMPYSAGFKTFQGDWFDGCMIYRDWALQQPWCSKGPLINRKSTPDWFKNTDLLVNVPTHRMRDSVKNTERMFQDFSKFNVVSKTFYWGLDNSHFETMSPDRFPLSKLDEKYIAFHKERNIKMIGYLQATAWSDISTSFKKDPELAEKNLVRNYYGQSLYWNLRKKQFGHHRIAYPGEYWIGILGDVIEKMAEAGFSGAYMDSGNHAGNYLNFTDANPKESGGGTGYVHGAQKLLDSLRERARKINPEFVFTSESFWEGNIAHLDAFWVINNNSAYIENDRVIPIPMVDSVYHDYTIMFGQWESQWDLNNDRALSWAAKSALHLSWGVKPGSITPNHFYMAKENGDLGLEISQKIMEAYSKSRKFLTFGTMLRPPVIQDCKKINIRWCRGYSQKFQPLTHNMIITSAWRSPEREKALFLYNLTEEPQKFSAELKKKDYDFEKFHGTFKNVYPENFTPQISDNGETFIVSGELPPRIPVIFEIR